MPGLFHFLKMKPKASAVMMIIQKYISDIQPVQLRCLAAIPHIDGLKRPATGIASRHMHKLSVTG
jgi:hypothetical protein